MSQKTLLPNKYKKIGWIIFIASFLSGLFIILSNFTLGFLEVRMISIFPDQLLGTGEYFSTITVNLTKTIVGVLFIIGGLLVGFSKEKNEDEFIAKIRLSSLLWAVLVNYSLLIIAFLVIYDFAFFSVMMYNMFTVLLLFIFRFHFMLNKNSKFERDEE